MISPQHTDPHAPHLHLPSRKFARIIRSVVAQGIFFVAAGLQFVRAQNKAHASLSQQPSKKNITTYRRIEPISSLDWSHLYGVEIEQTHGQDGTVLWTTVFLLVIIDLFEKRWKE